jgi:hypothetical protein
MKTLKGGEKKREVKKGMETEKKIWPKNEHKTQ